MMSSNPFSLWAKVDAVWRAPMIAHSECCPRFGEVSNALSIGPR